MPQTTDTGSRAGSGYVQTPCRGNETLTDIPGGYGGVNHNAKRYYSNAHMAAGTAMEREFNSYQKEAGETTNNGRWLVIALIGG